MTLHVYSIHMTLRIGTIRNSVWTYFALCVRILSSIRCLYQIGEQEKSPTPPKSGFKVKIIAELRHINSIILLDEGFETQEPQPIRWCVHRIP